MEIVMHNIAAFLKGTLLFWMCTYSFSKLFSIVDMYTSIW